MKSKVLVVLYQEWKHIVKDRKMLSILFLVPIMYTFLFGYTYSGKQLKELQTAVVNLDNSQLSRQMIQAFDESESFQIVDTMQSEQQLREALKSGEIQVGLVIPESFYQHVLQGDNVPIVTLIDGSNMIVTNTASRAANTIVTTFSYGVSQTMLQQRGFQEEEVNATFSSIPYRARILYNPTSNYSEFMVYGLIGAILQQVLFLGLSLAITRDKEQGVWESYREWKFTPWKIAFVKTAPYFIINLFNTVLTSIICIYWFKLPMEGSILPFLLLSMSFTFAVLGIGYLASLLAKTQLSATQVTMLVAVPSFILSGYTWSFQGMPDFLVGLAHLLPLTYYLEGVRHIFIKGNGIEYIVRDVVSLGLIGFITFFIAFVATSFMMFRDQRTVE